MVDPATLTPEAKATLIKEGEERMLAMQLIMNADPDKYGSLIESYDRDFLSGEKKYPTPPPRCISSAQGVEQTSESTGAYKSWAIPPTRHSK